MAKKILAVVFILAAIFLGLILMISLLTTLPSLLGASLVNSASGRIGNIIGVLLVVIVFCAIIFLFLFFGIKWLKPKKKDPILNFPPRKIT